MVYIAHAFENSYLVQQPYHLNKLFNAKLEKTDILHVVKITYNVKC